MYILGISSYYHDSAATLLKDGEIIGAIEEERFTRVKHDNSFPFKAIEFVLKSNGLTIKDIDHVAYYEKPLLKLERILANFVKTYPLSLRIFIDSIGEVIGNKIKIESLLRKNIGFQGKIYFIPHHLSHAASTFLTSSYKKAAVLTIDAVGDISTTEIWKGEGANLTNLGSIYFPHSIGLLYSTFTSFLGFRVNNDEYKVMGLAAYGKPIYKGEIMKMIQQYVDGSFELNLSYFSYTHTRIMWSNKFETLFGKPRKPDEKIVRRHKDIAASLQVVTEDLYMKVLNVLYHKTRTRNLCIAGGVGLNSLANGKIFERTPFKKVNIIGPAGDSGASLGAALFTYTNILGRRRPSCLKTLYLGSKYDDDEIKSQLDRNNLKYQLLTSNRKKIQKTVALLVSSKIVGWFQGCMEFGPRALGSRSILADPKERSMKTKVNKIKKRENFRPFAGSILQNQVHTIFNVPEQNFSSPFMNFCFKVKELQKKKISAIVHNDGTTRIQTVNKDNGQYYDLISAFYKKTGIPCILNTSFNLSHEPIVESPSQAIWDFQNSPMDALVIGSYLVIKNQ